MNVLPVGPVIRQLLLNGISSGVQQGVIILLEKIPVAAIGGKIITADESQGLARSSLPGIGQA